MSEPQETQAEVAEEEQTQREVRYEFQLDEGALPKWRTHEFGFVSPTAIEVGLRRLHSKGLPPDGTREEDGVTVYKYTVTVDRLERLALMTGEFRQQVLRLRFRQGIHPKLGNSQWEVTVKSLTGAFETKYVVDGNSLQPTSHDTTWRARSRKYSVVENPDFRLVIVELLEEEVSERAKRRRVKNGHPASGVPPVEEGPIADVIDISSAKAGSRCHGKDSRDDSYVS